MVETVCQALACSREELDRWTRDERLPYAGFLPAPSNMFRGAYWRICEVHEYAKWKIKEPKLRGAAAPNTPHI